jgi:hypothetical protein
MSSPEPSGPAPLFKYDQATGELQPGFDPGSADMEPGLPRQSSWETLVTGFFETSGIPELKQIGEFWRKFPNMLTPQWIYHFEQLARNWQQQGNTDPGLNAVRQNALSEAALVTFNELAAEAEINHKLREQQQAGLCTELEKLPLSRRLVRPLSGMPHIIGLDNVKVEPLQPEELKDLTEAQLFTLETLVQQLTSGSEDNGVLSELMDAGLVFYDLFALGREDGKAADLLQGCRAALLKVNAYRRPYLNAGADPEQLPLLRSDPVAQRIWLMQEGSKGAAGVGRHEEGMISVRTSVAGFSTLMHDLIPGMLLEQNRPVTEIMQLLLPGFLAAKQDLFHWGKAISRSDVNRTFREMNDPEGTINVKLAEAFRTTSRILAHMFIAAEYSVADSKPDGFNQMLLLFLHPEQGLGAENLLKGKLAIKAENNLARKIAGDQELRSQWDHRPDLVGRSQALLDSTFVNLLNDCLFRTTGQDLMPLAQIFVPDAELELQLGEQLFESEPTEAFSVLQQEVTSWLVQKYPVDIIRSSYALIMLADILEHSPMQRFKDQMFPEVQLTDFPTAGFDGGEMYLDALVVAPEAAQRIKKQIKAAGTGNRSASIVEIGSRLGTETTVLPVEYKMLISANGPFTRRTGPRPEDIKQMHSYLERLHELQPDIKVPRVKFIYVTLAGVNEVDIEVDPGTWRLLGVETFQSTGRS